MLPPQQPRHCEVYRRFFIFRRRKSRIKTRAVLWLPPTMASSHYTTLGISPMASNAEVRHAYRNLAKKWHPDSLPESKKAEGEKKFKEICAAYNQLKDVQSRREYDSMPNYQHRPFRRQRYGSSPFSRATSREGDTFKRQHYGNDENYKEYTQKRYSGFEGEFKGYYQATAKAQAGPKVPGWMRSMVSGRKPMWVGLTGVTFAGGFAVWTVGGEKRAAKEGKVLAWYNGQMGRWEEPTPEMLNRKSFVHLALQKVSPHKVHKRNANGEVQAPHAPRARPWYKR
ncbi:hypothetical protein AAMO2058_000403500 [Amorphochlora amoebiformis]